MKLRYPLILLIALLPRLLLAEGFSTPDALLAEKAALESGPCDLDCNLKIADMYSAAYLEALRSAVMPGLRNEEYGQENTMLLFGEKIPASELDAMSAQEFLARQLLYRGSTVPADYRFSRLEIISEKKISDSETRLLVLHSGLAGNPKLKEEVYMTFVKEGEGWKIKH